MEFKHIAVQHGRAYNVNHQPFLWRYRDFRVSQLPETSDIKFDTGDYVVDVTPHAKIQNDRPIGGVWVYGINITLAWFVVFHFF